MTEYFSKLSLNKCLMKSLGLNGLVSRGHLVVLCPQGQGLAVEEEQRLATGSPPREWGKNMFSVVY